MIIKQLDIGVGKTPDKTDYPNETGPLDNKV